MSICVYCLCLPINQDIDGNYCSKDCFLKDQFCDNFSIAPDDLDDFLEEVRLEPSGGLKRGDHAS